ncbi:NADPH-dependent F420 reductase [Pseudoclavibacter terrae]|uniref:NADPH-dependent F420 reductase n=1 Tax=Pseudoclavibacter terrae TaxID=1530195 RepID=UPI00232AF2AE|nr:NAD(P)-binding domain-containing protein [Pseudoclavibacter terrae]
MKISSLGIIGSGYIGTAVARLAVAAGLPATVANSRGTQSLADLVAELGPLARAGTVDEAAAQSIVVLAIPFGAVSALSAVAFSGRVVIDATNYFRDRDDGDARLNDASITSSQYVQAALRGARVAKTLNTVDFLRLASLSRGSGAPDRAALPLFGDDAVAIKSGTKLLDLLGFDAVELGGLAESWRAHPGTPLYVTPYQGGAPEGVEDPRERFIRTETVQVSAPRIRQLALNARQSAPGTIADVSSSS